MTLADTLARARTLPIERQQEIADFVDFLLNRYGAAASPMSAPAPLDLSQAFFGMWADREDMTDSTAYIQDLRRNEWENRHAGD